MQAGFGLFGALARQVCTVVRYLRKQRFPRRHRQMTEAEVLFGTKGPIRLVRTARLQRFSSFQLKGQPHR